MQNYHIERKQPQSDAETYKACTETQNNYKEMQNKHRHKQPQRHAKQRQTDATQLQRHETQLQSSHDKMKNVIYLRMKCYLFVSFWALQTWVIPLV